MAQSCPPIDAQDYELVVKFRGDKRGAKEFAREIGWEFGCQVEVLDIATGEMEPALKLFNTKPNGTRKRQNG